MNKLKELKQKIEKISFKENIKLERLFQEAKSCLENDDEAGYNKIYYYFIQLQWEMDAFVKALEANFELLETTIKEFKEMKAHIKKLEAPIQSTKTTVKENNNNVTNNKTKKRKP